MAGEAGRNGTGFVTNLVRSAWDRLTRQPRPRPWTAAVAWPLAAGTAALALIRVLGLDSVPLLVQLIAFTPYLLVASAVAAVATALTRRPFATAIAGVAALSLLAVVMPRTVGSSADGPGTPLVVMAANLRLGGADVASIVELVREAEVDVLALQELTVEAETALLVHGLAEELPYRVSEPGRWASGSAVYARLPLTDPGVRWATPDGFAQAYGTITANGRALVIESVHPVAPSGIGQTNHWLTGMRGQVPADAPGPPRILAGDFNATLDHDALRDLLATGYQDAAEAVGAGLTPTWPYYGRRAPFTPKVALDHILVPKGIGVRDFRAVTIPRTDHRAVVATLLIP